MRARCDDQRQAEFARPVNREPDEVVTILLDTGSALGEGLLQAVSDDDDLVVLAQLSPDFLGIVGRQHAAFRHGQEPGMSHVPEVQAFLGISQPDRHRDGVVFGEEAGQPDEDRGLAGPTPPTSMCGRRVSESRMSSMITRHSSSRPTIRPISGGAVSTTRCGLVFALLTTGDVTRRSREEEYRRGRGHRKERYKEPDLGAARQAVLPQLC